MKRGRWMRVTKDTMVHWWLTFVRFINLKKWKVRPHGFQDLMSRSTPTVIKGALGSRFDIFCRSSSFSVEIPLVGGCGFGIFAVLSALLPSAGLQRGYISEFRGNAPTLLSHCYSCILWLGPSIGLRTWPYLTVAIFVGAFNISAYMSGSHLAAPSNLVNKRLNEACTTQLGFGLEHKHWVSIVLASSRGTDDSFCRDIWPLLVVKKFLTGFPNQRYRVELELTYAKHKRFGWWSLYKPHRRFLLSSWNSM